MLSFKMAVAFPVHPPWCSNVVELAADPGVDVMRIVTEIKKDPGLSAKVLRIANSALYTKQRQERQLAPDEVLVLDAAYEVNRDHATPGGWLLTRHNSRAWAKAAWVGSLSQEGL